MTRYIETKIDDYGVATVTINNPDKHNAFDDIIIAQLHAAFEAIENDQNVRIMILAAMGKSFSAGADINWMKRMAGYSYEQNLQDAKALAKMLKRLNTLSKPTIARVQGAAFGGAVGLVSCCDMAIASPRASFCLSEVKIGLVPATIAPYVIAAIGPKASRRYFLTAERFSADEALNLGLLNNVVPGEELDDTIALLVSNLLNNSPQALGMAKQLIFDVANQTISNDLVTKTSELIASIRVSDEGQEGLSAFLDKRPASWLKNNNGDANV